MRCENFCHLTRIQISRFYFEIEKWMVQFVLINRNTFLYQVQAELRVSWEEKEYLVSYFRREKHIMENAYGPDWKKYLKHPELPRQFKFSNS